MACLPVFRSSPDHPGSSSFLHRTWTNGSSDEARYSGFAVGDGSVEQVGVRSRPDEIQFSGLFVANPDQ
jgi:hypothetical protein